MKQFLHPAHLILVIYTLGVLLTFGYTYNQYDKVSTKSNYEIERVSGSVVCAMAFPLYWSIKLFEK